MPSVQTAKRLAGPLRVATDNINQYDAKVFRIKRVTSDGEPAIKATKLDLEALGVELNVLGHGSHTSHTEAAIRHAKNKARSTRALICKISDSKHVRP